MKTKFLAFCLIVCLFLCSCSFEKNTDENTTDTSIEKTSDNNTSKSSEKDENDSNETAENITSSDGEAFAYLTEQTSENVICIQVPIYENEKLNELIKSRIIDFLSADWALKTTPTLSDRIEDIIKSDYSEYLVDLTCRYACKSDEVHSIIFEGLINYKTAAYPTNAFFTVNFDPETGKDVSFTDNYTVNEEMYDIFVESSIESITNRSGGEYPEEFNNFSQTLCSFEKFSGEYATMWYYYTDEAVGMSYSVPHVLGDHFETEISYEKLERFKKNP